MDTDARYHCLSNRTRRLPLPCDGLALAARGSPVRKQDRKAIVRVETMRRHIMDLCEKHDIELMWCRRPMDAWADGLHATVCVALIKSTISYAPALHEIGHVRGRHQLSRDSMVRERPYGR
jgi:hypothetical protein